MHPSGPFMKAKIVIMMCFAAMQWMKLSDGKPADPYPFEDFQKQVKEVTNHFTAAVDFWVHTSRCALLTVLCRSWTIWIH